MSEEQLATVIDEIQRTFGAWGDDMPLDAMRAGWDAMFSDVVYSTGATSEAVSAGGVKAEWIDAPAAESDRVVIYLHGGGYVMGSVNSHRDICERYSQAAQARVLGLDYRLAPEHPFPAALDDTLAAYLWVLEQGISPERVALAGDSAGGGLTFSALISLRDRGLPMPACATPLSPWVDFEGTGESITSRAALDPMVRQELDLQMGKAYMGEGGDLRNPLAAPLYAELHDLPPLLIQVGEREILFDDSAQMAEKAEKAGVDVTLREWKGMVHVWQIFASRLDEGQQAIEELGAFVRKHTP